MNKILKNILDGFMFFGVAFVLVQLIGIMQDVNEEHRVGQKLRAIEELVQKNLKDVEPTRCFIRIIDTDNVVIETKEEVCG